ncbi:MAG: hypothetical protein KIT25_05950 [Enhydrobacter sp.]|nr:MAG: hypothetical protein KIT25_05950 [Enhydrobacter sp.]
MNVPEWLKPGVSGALVGAAAIAIFSFSAGWVVTSGSARTMAEVKGEKAVIAALTPICVAQFKGQAMDERSTQLAALERENSWQRGGFVERQGWATMPGSDEARNEVANACADELMKLTTR